MRNAIEGTTGILRELLVHLASERGLAENSLLAYRRDLLDAEAFLTARGKDWLSAGSADLREYIQSQTRAGKKTETVRRRFVSLRVMLLFLRDQKKIDKNEAIERMDKPKKAEPLPKILSIQQVNKLIDAGGLVRNGEGGSKLGVRDRAIFEVLYACGLRVSELCGLRLMDVNLGERSLRVMGKGSKERIVPMTPAATAAIARYIDGRRGGRAPLFVSASGKALDRFRIYQLVKAAGKRIGLAKAISPHVLRHCFASHLLSGGADLRVVQELLGHANPDNTEIYTHLDGQRLKQAAKLHPRARDKKKEIGGGDTGWVGLSGAYPAG